MEIHFLSHDARSVTEHILLIGLGFASHKPSLFGFMLTELLTELHLFCSFSSRFRSRSSLLSCSPLVGTAASVFLVIVAGQFVPLSISLDDSSLPYFLLSSLSSTLVPPSRLLLFMFFLLLALQLFLYRFALIDFVRPPRLFRTVLVILGKWKK